MKKPLRKHRFLIGYLPDKNVVYSKGLSDGGWLEPMTRFTAEQWAKRLPSDGGAVFELVPVSTYPSEAKRRKGRSPQPNTK